MEQKRIKTANTTRFSDLQKKLREEVKPEEVIEAARECASKMEKINHPSHYKGNKYEAIDIIEDFGLGFNLGNAIKYILRAGKKGLYTEDIKKAVWYLEREIDHPS